MLDFELEIAAVIGADGEIAGLHAAQRLERARRPARGDDRRARSGEGQGLRDLARALARHARRAAVRGRAPRARGDRDRQRSRADPHRRGASSTGRGPSSSPMPRATRACAPATCSARARSTAAACSSWARWRASASSSRATRSTIAAEGLGRSRRRSSEVDCPADYKRATLLDRALEQGRQHDLGLGAEDPRRVAQPLERLLEVLGVARVEVEDRARLAGDRVGGGDLGVAAGGGEDLRAPASAPRRRARRPRGSSSPGRRGRAPPSSRGSRRASSSRSTRRLTAGALERDPRADVLERAAGVLAQQRNDLLVDLVELATCRHVRRNESRL